MHRLTHWFGKRLRVVLRVAAFGTMYGMACGGIYGGVIGVGIGAPFGAFYGALGGLITGLLGGLIGGPVGWGLAGLAGGLVAPVAVYPSGILLAGGPGPMPTWFYLFPSLIGGSVGLGVGIGLRRGASQLPGVTRFAEAVRAIEAEAPPPRLPRAAAPTQLAPAAAPEGRGSEVSAGGRAVGD